MDNLAKQFNKVENNVIRYIYIKYIQTNQIEEVEQVEEVDNYQSNEQKTKESYNKEIGDASKDSDNDDNEQLENEEELDDAEVDDAESDLAEADLAEADLAEADNNDNENKKEFENPVIGDSRITTSGNTTIKTKPRRYKIQDPYRYTLFKKNIFTQKRSCAVISQEELIRDDLYTMKLADTAYECNPKEFRTSNFDIPPDVLRCSFIRKHHHRYIRCKNRISCDDSDVCKKHENNENIYLDAYNDLLETLGIE